MKYPIHGPAGLFVAVHGAQQDGQNALQELYQDVLHPSDPLLNGREYEYYFQPSVYRPRLSRKNLYPPASVTIRQKQYSECYVAV